MYDVYYESGEKAFGCSSLETVKEYMADIGVVSVTLKKDMQVNLSNGEYIILAFGCPTAADDWIRNNVPGSRAGITSIKGGCIYNYEKGDE